MLANIAHALGSLQKTSKSSGIDDDQFSWEPRAEVLPMWYVI